MSGLLAIVAYAALSVGLCSTAVAQAVVIGAKEFTEQLLVAEMTAQLLRASGLNPIRAPGSRPRAFARFRREGSWMCTGSTRGRPSPPSIT